MHSCGVIFSAFLLAVSARAMTIDEYDSLSGLIDSLEEVREDMIYSQQSLGIRIFGEARPYLMYHFGGGRTKVAHFVNDSFPTMWSNEFGQNNGQSQGQFAYVTNQGPGRLDFCREANEPFLRLRIHARPLRDLQLRLSLSLTNRLLGGEAFATRGGHWFFSFAQLQLFEELAAEIKLELPVLGKFKTTLGGVLWQDYSPFTLWDKKVKLFPFFKSPWEGNYGQLDIYRSNMLKGEDYGPFTWVKRGIKGIMFKSLELPRNLEFTGHFGIINSAWSEKYVKNRVFSTEEAPFADSDFTR